MVIVVVVVRRVFVVVRGGFPHTCLQVNKSYEVALGVNRNLLC